MPTAPVHAPLPVPGLLYGVVFSILEVGVGPTFGAALRESLAVAELASATASEGQYKIDADLVTLKQPLFGLTFDVVSTVNYRVYKEGFEKLMPITATGTATTSDAFVGITRLKIANEKSMQQNITEFIKQLANSDIK